MGQLSAFHEELADASTWYFTDGVLPRWVGARTVMVCSPKWDVYKEWLKPEDIKLTMPIWTWPEIKTLWQLYYKGECPELALERVRRNFDVWYGGCPRMILERPSKRILPSGVGLNEVADPDAELALDAINGANVEQVLAAIQGQYDSGSETSHRIVHRDGDRFTFEALSRSFATRNMGILFGAKVRSSGPGLYILQQLASSSNPNKTSQGKIARISFDPVWNC